MTNTYKLGRAGANAVHIVTRYGELCTPDRNAIHRRAAFRTSPTEFATLETALAALSTSERPCRRCLAAAGQAA